jgi:hypothetical protein
MSRILASVPVLATVLVLSTAGPLRAEPPYVMDARVVEGDGGQAGQVEVRLVGGVSPFRGELHVARPGGEFQALPLAGTVEPHVLAASIPPDLAHVPFGWFVTVQDAEGSPSTKGSATAPLFYAPDEPPMPGAALAPLPGAALPADDVALPPPAVALPPPAPAPEPRAKPSAAPPLREELQQPARRARAGRRVHREVLCCGIPISGPGKGGLMVAGAAVAGLGAVLAGGVSLVFLVDLARAVQMYGQVQRAKEAGYARPSSCSPSWSRCEERYTRAMAVDGVVVLLGGGLTMALLTSAVALLTAGAAVTRP